MFLSLTFFNWISYLFTFQMLSPFLVSPPETPFPSPLLLCHLPTHPLPPHRPGIPVHWGIKPSQDQGPLLPWMPNKDILCYICVWSHGSSSMYTLWLMGALGVLVVDIFVLPMGLQTTSALSVLSLTPPLESTFSVQLTFLWKITSTYNDRIKQNLK